jgi:hypothetical protein
MNPPTARTGRRSSVARTDEAIATERSLSLADCRSANGKGYLAGILCPWIHSFALTIAARLLPDLGHTAPIQATKKPMSRHFESGSDGTRTRDLRRDRPRKGRDDPPRDDPEEPD